MAQTIRLRSLLTAAAMVPMLALAACGGNSGSSASPEPGGSAAPGEAKVSIQVFTEFVGSHPFAPYWKQRLQAFKDEHPNIDVKVEEIAGAGNNSMDGKLKVLISSGELPDVFLTNDKDMIEIAKNANLLTDLKPMLDQDADFNGQLDQGDLEDWNNGTEHVYGISSHKDFYGYFYNKEMFEKAGITPAGTWDEFFANLEKLKETGVAPLSLETKNVFVSSSMLLALTGTQSAEGNRFALTPSPGSYETPEFIEAAKQLQNMYMNYTTKDAIGGDYAVAQNNFFNEKTAIFSTGTWDISLIRDGAPEGFGDKVGVAMFPNNGIFSFPAYAWFSGSKDDAKAKAAYEFIKHFNNKEDQGVRLEMLDFMPVDTSINLSEYEVDPLLQDYINMRDDVQYRMMSPWRVYQSSVSAIISQELAALGTGASTPEQFAKRLTEAANK
ncbi:ABC transporter substrate-binding protein [Cohnella cellulosilytica]|uniref:ABC transporter substrate-binding protein n=1 Tax=Cohnella cellulosilytica TaxID=986710 RepID=A0ABW2F6B0_9BACL